MDHGTQTFRPPDPQSAQYEARYKPRCRRRLRHEDAAHKLMVWGLGLRDDNTHFVGSGILRTWDPRVLGSHVCEAGQTASFTIKRKVPGAQQTTAKRPCTNPPPASQMQ